MGAVFSSIWTKIVSIWTQLSPRVKLLLVGGVTLVLFILGLLAKLHSLEGQAAAFRTTSLELQTKNKVEAVQADITAEKMKVDADAQKVAVLEQKAEDHKAELTKHYQSEGMSSNEITEAFKKLNL